MKSLFKILLSACLLTSGIAAHAQDENSIRFEVNGTAYTATDVTGTVMIGKDKKAILAIHTSLQSEDRMVQLNLDMKKFGEFKPGTVPLGPMDNEEIKNFGLLINVVGDGLASTDDPAAGAPDAREINADSDKGNFTLTAARIDGNTAIISGRFEFHGVNSVDIGTVKKVTVKGSFKDLEINCLSPKLLRP